MKPLTAEWLEKAEGDFAVMERESRVRRNPAHDIVCFHAQQCVEKYLEARLCHAGAEAGRLWELLGVSATEQGTHRPLVVCSNHTRLPSLAIRVFPEESLRLGRSG